MNLRNIFQTKKQALKRFLDKNPTLIDVRNPGELIGNNIPSAINIPLDNLFENLPNLDKNKDYVLFCRSGNRSRIAMDLMKTNGFTSLFDAGSIDELKKLDKYEMDKTK
jgi:rhodanese-related sulfurtransferase